MVFYLIVLILIVYILHVIYDYYYKHKLPKTTEISGVVIDELQMLL